MRLAILGIDGLYPEFLETFADDLPNLRRLCAEGTSAPLLSTIPPFTPQAWTTMLTGANPGTHGIAGFTVRDAGRELLADRTSIRVRQLGDYLNEHGVTFALLNVPLTYPAPRLRGGATVAGMLTPNPRSAGFSWPPELAGELAAAVPDYVIDTAVTKQDAGDAAVWPRLETMVRARANAVRFLSVRCDPDVLFVVFVVLDRLLHLGFSYTSPADPRFDSREGHAFRRRLAPLLRELDRSAGELADRADRVLVVSDHGFRREEGKFYVNRFLAGEGLFRVRSSLKRGAVDLAVSLLGRERLRRLVPRRLFERGLAGTGGGVPLGAPARASPLAAQGIVVPDTALRERLLASLRELRHPRDGRRLVSNVHRREEIYRGPATDRFPHLVLELRNGGIEVSPHLVGRESISLAADDWPGGHHDRRGTFVAWGTHIPHANRETPLDMVDVLPTILALLGLRVPAELEGRAWEA